MCLIVLAHRADSRFPFVLAANRDEDHERPSLSADLWPEAPQVVGGRDAVHGGSWLAITNRGRFAAVTNLRGAMRKSRSRGALVRDFVTSNAGAREFAQSIVAQSAEYAGFHLIAGEADGELLHITPDSWLALPDGIHAISNAPLGEEWPKTTIAAETMEDVLRMESAEEMREALMAFLTAPRHSGRVESEIFIEGERYGTRASTVLLMDARGISFAERTFAKGGVPLGDYSLALPIVTPE